MSTASASTLALASLSALIFALPASSSPLLARATIGDATPTWTGSNWLIPVTFGNSQTLSLVFDTGSSSLFVLSNLNPGVATTPSLTPGTYYDVSKSTTMSYLNPGESMNITYEDGSGGRGPMASEIVTIGGVTFPNQHIGVTNWTNPFPGPAGIIGMPRTALGHYGGAVRFDSNNSIDYNEPTFFDNVAGQLSSPIWTAHLKTSTSAASTISFGHIDNTKYTGALSSANLVTTNGNHWVVNSTSASINGKIVKTSSIQTMTMDTGTTHTYIDPAVAQALYAAVPGATNTTNSDGSVTYYHPCNLTLSQLPSFSISMGDNGGYASITSALLSTNTHGNCISKVQPTSGTNGVLGTDFFNANYVVFDPFNNPARVQYAVSA